MLKSDGFVVESVQSSPAFHRYRVPKGEDSVLIDLVADPVPALEEPREFFLEGVAILVDTEREILVNKLCTLLERSELRDLQDVRTLLEAGGDLESGLAQAPQKDAGFSALTFAWVLRELPITSLGLGSGWPIEEVASLERFRDDLVQKVAHLAKPELNDESCVGPRRNHPAGPPSSGDSPPPRALMVCLSHPACSRTIPTRGTAGPSP